MPMGITAENLATQYQITREASDAFSVRSQQLWGKGCAVAPPATITDICSARGWPLQR
jgi:hypothetical protein